MYFDYINSETKISSFLKLVNPMLISLTKWVQEHTKLSGIIMASAASLGVLLTALGGIALLLPGLATVSAAWGVTMGAALGTMTLAALQFSLAIAGIVAIFQFWDEINVGFFAFADEFNQALSTMSSTTSKFISLLSLIPGPMQLLYKGAAIAIAKLSDELALNAKTAADQAANSYSKIGEKSKDMTDKIKESMKGTKEEMMQALAEMSSGIT
jgi:hypothetical protein